MLLLFFFYFSNSICAYAYVHTHMYIILHSNFASLLFVFLFLLLRWLHLPCLQKLQLQNIHIFRCPAFCSLLAVADVRYDVGCAEVQHACTAFLRSAELHYLLQLIYSCMCVYTDTDAVRCNMDDGHNRPICRNILNTYSGEFSSRNL